MLLFVDNLTNVDFSYLDPERGLVGETWLANIRLHGDLNEQSMVCDFGRVKKVVRHWLDTELDHRLAVPARSPHLTLRETDDRLELTWQLDDGSHIFMSSPRQAVALVDAEVLDADSIARWCETQLEIAFAQKLEKLELDFSTETIDGAFYHYSHGLKKHDGNCQRIAHGHRSRIDIWQDGDKAPTLEKHWAELWRDIYIGTREDILHAVTLDGVDYLEFTYQAPQGEFTLRLPQARCYLIDTDTTVECLAQHIAAETARAHPNTDLRIRAYEGINKGAEAYR
ncbi:6-carboxytetrahydropterin synthase [Gilvimarinus xylanilyticus]|uniref:6-carboxy-5,6,7,8-tetrahydropterin synthase n=1 Tax=Gilvimarinus xylanilyticus TaxID=2944139 RepID=A0A9X2HWN3_9GAMM|nr:6-carboxytetrahydropterin synthase [Gilvimarinus xylanilyticus]MCP8899044.1 6-carboxytetrahydropterin synthase [Gilvimarinus xylanilyticus]